MSELKDLVRSAFYNPSTGLSRNIAKLKERNASLALYPSYAIKAALNQLILEYNKNKKAFPVKDFVKYRSKYPSELINVDLMFLNSPKNTRQNIIVKDYEKDKEYNYALICVDTYSRFLFVYYLKDKSSEKITEKIHECVREIRDIFFEGFSDLQSNIISDKGREFSNAINNKSKKIKHIIAKNKSGALLAESAIYKIRKKLQYIENGDRKRKIDIETMKDIINNVNSEGDAYNILYKNILKERDRLILPDKKEQEYKQGDYVRILNEKDMFEKKSSISTFSNRIYVVLEALYYRYDGIFRYKVGSIDGKYEIDRLFYENELNSVSFTEVSEQDNDEYKKNNEFTKEEILKLNIIE